MSDLSLLGIDKSTTVGDLLAELDRWGAAHAEIVYRDGADVAVGAVIVVQGIPETGEIIAAIEALQEKWDSDLFDGTGPTPEEEAMGDHVDA